MMQYVIIAYNKRPASFNDFCFTRKDEVEIIVKADSEDNAYIKARGSITRDLYRIIKIEV